MIIVSGADLVDGTPIYDIKPYIPYADCKPDAVGGFTDKTEYKKLTIAGGLEHLDVFKDSSDRAAVEKILINDPRPHYQDDPDRVYGFLYGKHNINFKVDGENVYILRCE